MSKRLSKKGEVSLKVLADFPNHPTKTLADKIYNENPLLFKDAEDARCSIRYHRGESGDKLRSASTNYKEKGKAEKISTMIELPKTWSKEKKVFKIPLGYKNIGFISDVQAPFHDEKALEVGINHLIEKKIDCLFINGDFLDFYGLSNFEKDPRKRDFKGERDDCIQLLRWLRSKFKCPIYYNLDANHEYRYERYMMIKAPAIYATDMFNIEDLFMLHDIGIIPIKGYDHVMIGKLPVVHGHTVFKGQTSPVCPARTIYMKLKTTAIASHIHKVSQYTCVNLYGEVMSFWTTGCFMNLNVDYNQHGNDYTHGFAIIDILDETGSFRVNNHMIINNVVH